MSQTQTTITTTSYGNNSLWSTLQNFVLSKEGLHLIFLLITSLVSIILAGIAYYNPAINFVFIVQLLLFVGTIVNIIKAITVLYYRSVICRFNTLIDTLIYMTYIILSLLSFLTVVIYCVTRHRDQGIGITIGVITLLDGFSFIICVIYCMKLYMAEGRHKFFLEYPM
ncbi:hypothetical protein MXB_1161 [Myxobolus squamalis]|nr:hypothetical protein MXB_1161 [Myxobolus squamalis]